jgi:hypothetical protein
VDDRQPRPVEHLLGMKLSRQDQLFEVRLADRCDRPTGVAALYLGKREGQDLLYMGKVGTGWSRTYPARSGSSSTMPSPRNRS